MPRAIAPMNARDLTSVVATAKGARLRAMLDAALDVAQQSVDSSLRRAAMVVLAAGRQSHPEFFDPTLRGC